VNLDRLAEYRIVNVGAGVLTLDTPLILFAFKVKFLDKKIKIKKYQKVHITVLSK
jgi:hypothetical protein